MDDGGTTTDRTEASLDSDTCTADPDSAFQRAYPSPTLGDANQVAQLHSLNQNQHRLINTSLTQLITLRHGSPGTGKTKTATALCDLCHGARRAHV